MTNIFITGVSGFVGSSLVHFFSSLPDVRLFGHSRDKEGTAKKYQGLKIQLVDKYDNETFDALNINCIIHLAGIAHDLSNRYVEADYFRVNDEATRHIYDDFLKSQTTTFIYLSSIKAAIDHHTDPVDESVIPNPYSAYGRSKLQAEQYIQSRSLPAAKTYYILRPCMIHGPDNKGNLNALYKFVKHGLPYPFGAFKNKRSFLSIDNLTFIINKLIGGSINRGIYHVADAEALPTAEVVKIIAQTLQKKPRILNLSPVLMRLIFGTFAKNTLRKLTETMVVSNKKIVDAIRAPLPCTAEQGLTKTIRSFNE
jgi:nucleoside-diphosphate-sugar epimerase